MTGSVPRLMDSGGGILERWIVAWRYLVCKMPQLAPDVNALSGKHKFKLLTNPCTFALLGP